MNTETECFYRKTCVNCLPILIAAFLLILSGATFAQPQTPATAEAYVERGNQFFKYGYLDQAIADYTKAIELKPTLPDAYNNRGLVYNQQKKSILAIQDLTNAIQLSPQNPLYYKNRAVAYGVLDWVKAMTDLDAAIKLDPKDASSWNERGLLYTKGTQGSNNSTRSIEDFTEAIRLRPGYAEAYKNRADSYRELWKFDLAIADYTKAIELLPNYSAAYHGRSEAYRLTNETDLAIADSTKAIQLQPNFAQYYFRRARHYLQRSGGELPNFYTAEKRPDPGSVELALADVNTAIRLAPNDGDLFVLRARAYCLLNKKDLSNADYETAKKLGSRWTTKCY